MGCDAVIRGFMFRHSQFSGSVVQNMAPRGGWPPRSGLKRARKFGVAHRMRYRETSGRKMQYDARYLHICDAIQHSTDSG